MFSTVSHVNVAVLIERPPPCLTGPSSFWGKSIFDQKLVLVSSCFPKTSTWRPFAGRDAIINGFKQRQLSFYSPFVWNPCSQDVLEQPRWSGLVCFLLCIFFFYFLFVVWLHDEIWELRAVLSDLWPSISNPLTHSITFKIVIEILLKTCIHWILFLLHNSTELLVNIIYIGMKLP